MTDAAISSLPTERSLLIVEDDKSFLQRLARAMEGRGFTVTTAESVGDGLLQVEKAAPAFAIVVPAAVAALTSYPPSKSVARKPAPSSSPVTAT
jgi:CheY-like chemotaxis protein